MITYSTDSGCKNHHTEVILMNMNLGRRTKNNHTLNIPLNYKALICGLMVKMAVTGLYLVPPNLVRAIFYSISLFVQNHEDGSQGAPNFLI